MGDYYTYKLWTLGVHPFTQIRFVQYLRKNLLCKMVLISLQVYEVYEKNYLDRHRHDYAAVGC